MHRDTGERELCFPIASSVFYFDKVGGGTAVAAQTESMETGDLLPQLPDKVLVSFPRKNQLLLFRGDLYHGVLWPSTCSRQTDNNGGGG